MADDTATVDEIRAELAASCAREAALAGEVERRDRALAEALEQQTATAEILRVIASSPNDLARVLNAVAQGAMRLCETHDATIIQVVGGGCRMIWNAGLVGVAATPDQVMAIDRNNIPGRAIADGATVHVPDVMAVIDEEFPGGAAMARHHGIRSALVAPLMQQGTAIGAIYIRRTELRPFTDEQIALLETFADQAVIAIENARLFEELERRNREVSEALEQQTATAIENARLFEELEDRTAALVRSVEELRALGEVGQAVSSSLDLDTVLATIVANASRLSGSGGGVLYEYDDVEGVFVLRAAHDAPDEMVALLRRSRFRLGEGTVGRAGATRAPFAVEDVATSDAHDPAVKAALLSVVGQFESSNPTISSIVQI